MGFNVGDKVIDKRFLSMRIRSREIGIVRAKYRGNYLVSWGKHMSHTRERDLIAPDSPLIPRIKELHSKADALDAQITVIYDEINRMTG